MPIFGRRSHRRSGGGKARLLIAAAIGAVALISYFARTSTNPITGESQRVALSTEQEIAMGLQTAPEMAAQFGGLHPDGALQDRVDRVGQRLVAQIEKAADVYPFEFHLLADPNTVNAFALPGGQIFITHALYSRMDTEGQLAGVLGHEIGHVVGRHSAEHLAKAQLTQGLVGAVAVGSDSYGAAAAAQAAAQMVNLKYGRDDELESDRLGVRYMVQAGYNPASMVRVMQVLEEASGGARNTPEFAQTHPNPGNRIEKIEQAIRETFPDGLPPDLED